MRAIVNCRLGFPPDQLSGTLKQLVLLPDVAQDNQIVVTEREAIFADIHAAELEYARATYQLTILEHDTRTWGIISGGQQVEIRLKNHNPERLRRAVENIVARLSDYADFNRPRVSWWFRGLVLVQRIVTRTRAKSVPPLDAFDFVPPVEVREAKSDQHSFSGRIRSQRSLGVFMRVRRREKHLVLVSAVIALGGFTATVPPIAALWQIGLQPRWAAFWFGHVERLTTAAALVCIVWLIELYVGWSEYRHRRVVEWLPD
jgi:hypothetical protein